MSRGAVDALLEEWDRGRLEIVALLPRIRDAELEQGDALDETCPRGILIHVLRSSYTYASWTCDVLGFAAPQRTIDPKTIAGRDAFQRAFAAVHEFFTRALDPLTDAHLDPTPGTPPPKFRARWGEDYSVEQMLEHAICHNLRHRRQLSRMPIFKT